MSLSDLASSSYKSHEVVLERKGMSDLFAPNASDSITLNETFFQYCTLISALTSPVSDHVDTLASRVHELTQARGVPGAWHFVNHEI